MFPLCKALLPALLAVLAVGASWSQSTPDLGGEADVESRVTLHDNGTRTQYTRDGQSRELEAITFEDAESDVKVGSKHYTLDPSGRELRCLVRDGTDDLLFTVLYSYDEVTGRRIEEGTYRRDGRLVRVVAFPFEDGRALRPVVTLWRQNDVLWTHNLVRGDDGVFRAEGVVPVEGQEDQTGVSDDELAGLALDPEEVSDDAFVTEEEIRRAALNEEYADSGRIDIDTIIQSHDAEYLSEAMSADALMLQEQWRREEEARAAMLRSEGQ